MSAKMKKPIAMAVCMTDLTAILSQHRKVAIAGGPKTGKTTLSEQCTDLRFIFHTDDWTKSPWADVPEQILGALPDAPWLLEGIQVGRCLRKGLKPDAVIYLTTPHVTLTPGQKAMTKGCRTIFDEWLASPLAEGVAITWI